MTIGKRIFKPIDLLIHAAKKCRETPERSLPQPEWLDDHEFSFDAVGRGLNGLPPRRISEREDG